MGQISSLFIRKVVNEVDTDVDKRALLRSFGIEPDSPVEASHMVPADQYYGFLERLVAVDHQPTTLPLRAGAAMRCDDYGAFGLAWKSATNLRGSYERAVRHARVLTSVSTYEVEITNAGAYVHLHRSGERRLGMRLSNEATIASIASISREVSTEEFQPETVFFKHAAPESIADHEAYFGCPVCFESERDALLVSRDTLRTANKLGDETIVSFFDTHLEAAISELEDEQSLDRQVRNYISQSLSEGIPTISEVASQFCMSGRTLQRRLADQGYSFQNLIDESRRRLAERLLRKTDYSLAEIAFMTGFSEQSAFNRAFKRWAGHTPRSFRIKAQ